MNTCEIQENIDGINIIWFDPKIGTTSDTELTAKRLTAMDNNTKFYNDAETCIKYVQSMVVGKMILVTCGSKASDILPVVHNLRQVDNIFIYCQKPEKCQSSLQNYWKLLGICTELDRLLALIQDEIEKFQKHKQTFTILSQHQKSLKDLSTQSNEFLRFQLYADVIQNLPRDQNARRQMLTACCDYYRNHRRPLLLIADFERNYTSATAINWYTKQSFVYKLVNAALRNESVDQLHTFRYFIGDLSRNLAEAHKTLVQSGEKELTVYRGAKLSIAELSLLINNCNKAISANSYLSGSRNRERAILFALAHSNRSDVVPVLFQITCDIQQSANFVVVADVAQYSDYPNEEEVLFDFSTTFRIETITQDKTFYVINLSVSADREVLTQKYINITRDESEEIPPSIMFGRLMCDAGQYDKSWKYFEQLLLSATETPEIAAIHLNIGRSLYDKCDWTQARVHYDKAYELMLNAQPPLIKESAAVLRSIGYDLQRQGKYDEALEKYQKTHQIREKYYRENHPNIAQSFHDIGSVLDDKMEYKEALRYYRKALRIRENYYPANHPQIANTLNNMALIFKKQKNYDEALRFYEKARNIYESFYPGHHSNIGTCLQNIAAIFEIKHSDQDALKLYKRALIIYEEFYPSNHPDICTCQKAIESITRHVINNSIDAR